MNAVLGFLLITIQMNTLLKKGDKIPEFTLLDQHSEEVKISPDSGKPMVIYFYPKDDTPGCTQEACYFRDQFEVFTDYGALIIGISGDSPKSHLRFAEKYQLNFTLLSDGDRKIEKQFGVPRNLFGLLPGRVTFIVDQHGIIQHVFSSQFNASQHVEEALEVLKTLE